MTEEQIDIKKQAEDLANEKLENQKKEDDNKKVSELEAKLAEYQQKEEEAKLAEEEAKKSEMSKRLEEIEKARDQDKKDFENKLEQLSTRQTSGKVTSADAKKALSREDYDSNKDHYNTMLAKHILKNRKL